MDSRLVIQAQHGDEEAFASLALACGDRLHAVAHRILRDTDLAEDAAQQALVNIWRELPSLRDPDRFDAWSYRILVNACYIEGRRSRAWMPNLRLIPAQEPGTPGASAGSSIATSSNAHSDGSRSNIARSSSSSTTSTCRWKRPRSPSASRLER
jgi:DNA-directed RNA polymerase specialized sigma24 family protein